MTQLFRDSRWIRTGALATLAVGAAAAGHAQTPPLQNVVTLSASATVDVAKDWLSVTFSTTREGTEAAAVQTQLKQALEAALVEARKLAKPGQVEVQTGGFSLFPRYAQPTTKQQQLGQAGNISGWQGSTELIVEGRDQQAIAQLTARVQTLAIARVATSLSREAREKLEAEVTAQAINRFRARADAVSKQFGFSGYTVREVAVSADGAQMVQQPYVRSMALRAGAADEALPVEAGKAAVTMTVNGSVQLK